MKVFFLCMGLLGALLLPTTTVSAFATPDMTVSPAITEWMAKPGETQTKTVKVINPKTTPIPLRVVAEGMTVQEEIAKEDQSRFDASQWFSVSDPYFILKAKETHEVTITLKVPKNVEPGGHYATIYFQQFVPSTTTLRTMVAGQVGALALITVKGDVHQQLTDQGIQTERKSDGSIDFHVSLRNQGNVHVLPAGKLTVKDWQGRELANLPLPTGIALPSTERVYTMTWKKPPLFGYFTVTAEITYGNKDTIAPLSTHFWIAPGEWLITVFAVVIIAWWFGWRIRHRWARMFKILFAKTDSKTDETA